MMRIKPEEIKYVEIVERFLRIKLKDDGAYDFIITQEDIKRCCANCKHFEGICKEGGYSEISNPYEERTDIDCNAWERKGGKERKNN